MNITELLIGDWVRKKGKPHSIQVDDFIEVSNDHSKKKYYEPIPINPEILEKNRIRWDNHFGSYVSEDRRMTIDCFSNMIGREWHCHIDNEDFESIGSADIQNVHELQHLLLLCGIEREITL